MPELLIQWATRVVVAILAFLLVKWGLPLLLALGGFSLPDNIVTLLAILLALIALGGHYLYPRLSVRPPA